MHVAGSRPKVRRQGTPETLVILDCTNIPGDIPSGGRVVRIPITQTAVDVGNKVVANTVALGAFNALAQVVKEESLARAVAARVPAKFRDLNNRALEAGSALAAGLVAEVAGKEK